MLLEHLNTNLIEWIICVPHLKPKNGYHHFCDLHFPLLINQSHSHSGMTHNSVPYGLSIWLLATTRRAWTPSLQGRAQQTVLSFVTSSPTLRLAWHFILTFKLFCLFVFLFLFFGFDGLVFKNLFLKKNFHRRNTSNDRQTGFESSSVSN